MPKFRLFASQENGNLVFIDCLFSSCWCDGELFGTMLTLVLRVKYPLVSYQLFPEICGPVEESRSAFGLRRRSRETSLNMQLMQPFKHSSAFGGCWDGTHRHKHFRPWKFWTLRPCATWNIDENYLEARTCFYGVCCALLRPGISSPSNGEILFNCGIRIRFRCFWCTFATSTEARFSMDDALPFVKLEV